MRDLLVYDETSPSCLRWAVNGYNNSYRAGDVAGATVSGKNGYHQIMINKKKYMTHRVVYFILHGTWPENVDHINGNRQDNRAENLRGVTKRVNLCNLPKAVGFYLNKSTGKFVAQICSHGKNKNIGTFDTPFEARAAYLHAKMKEHNIVPGVGYPRD